MTQEEKQILLKDLCGRVPYGVIYHRNDGANIELREVDIKNGTLNYTDNIVVRDCKPYLRPMFSMTEEETYEYDRLVMCNASWVVDDWLFAHHFDFRKLIQKGLAIEASEEMYKSK